MTDIKDLFTADEINRLCGGCRVARHYSDWTETGWPLGHPHHPYSVALAYSKRCPCDGQCVQASRDWGRAVGVWHGGVIEPPE